MWAMFLRRNRRTVDGETYEYWTLCKAVRTARGPRQEVVAHLGKEPGLDSATRHGWEEVADLLEGGNPAPRQGRFGEQLPRACPRPQWAHVDLRGVRYGGAWSADRKALAAKWIRKSNKLGALPY
jgi:hypothetical protein